MIVHQTERVTLHHGDALIILPTLPSESCGAVITDPPYCSGGLFRGDRTQTTIAKYVRNDTAGPRLNFAGDSRDGRGFITWAALWLAECYRICRPAAACCLFTDWRQLPNTTDVLQAAGFIWRGIAAWIKPAARPQKGRLRQSAEFIVWGSKGPMATEGPCLPGHWITQTPSAEKALHIAIKPLVVLADLVELCPPGGTILDPFMGTATVGRAALDAGRRYIGIEIDATNAQRARERVAQELLPC